MILSVNLVLRSYLKWVSQLSTDHVVWLGDKHFVGFLLGEAMNES